MAHSPKPHPVSIPDDLPAAIKLLFQEAAYQGVWLRELGKDTHGTYFVAAGPQFVLRDMTKAARMSGELAQDEYLLPEDLSPAMIREMDFPLGAAETRESAVRDAMALMRKWVEGRAKEISS